MRTPIGGRAAAPESNEWTTISMGRFLRVTRGFPMGCPPGDSQRWMSVISG